MAPLFRVKICAELPHLIRSRPNVPAQNDANWFSAKTFGIALAVLIGLLFYDVLLGLGTFVIRDYSIFAYPLAHYHRECFWQGEIPLWNPYHNLGIPFLAQWSTLVLYPGSLIYLLLPLPWSLGVFCLVHLWFGGFGMFLLARKWTGSPFAAAIAGLSFALSGFALNCLMWPAFLASLMWMPWVVWLVTESWQGDRRKFMWAALAGASQMMTGAPEVIFLTWVLLGVLWLKEVLRPAEGTTRPILRFPLVVIIVAGLSAAQLLPFFDFLAESQRSAGYAGSTWSMPKWGWANFLVPLFRFYRAPNGVFFQFGQDWTSSYYAGVGVLLLALLAIIFIRNARVLLLFGLTVATILLAFGENTFVYPLVRKLAPPLGFMRFPVKFVLFAAFSLPLLAAFGAKLLAEAIDDARRNQSGARQQALQRCLIAISSVLTILVVAVLVYNRANPLEGENTRAVLLSGLSRIIILVLIVFAWLGLNSAQERTKRLSRAAFLILFILDPLSHAPSQNPRVPPPVYARGLSLEKMQPPPKLGESRAMMTRQTHDSLYGRMLANPQQDFVGRRLALFGNTSLIDRIPNVDGFYSLYLRQPRELWSALFFNPDTNATAGLADLLGVSLVSHPTEFLGWTQRGNPLPMITAGQRPVFLSHDQTLAAMASTNFNPREIVYLDESLKRNVAILEGTRATVSNLTVGSDSISARVNAAEDSWVLVGQSFTPKWKAYINKTETRIWQVNHALQAIQVPAGTHSVRLNYHDRAFLIGVAISLFSLLLVIGIGRIKEVQPLDKTSRQVSV